MSTLMELIMDKNYKKISEYQLTIDELTPDVILAFFSVSANNYSMKIIENSIATGYSDTDVVRKALIKFGESVITTYSTAVVLALDTWLETTCGNTEFRNDTDDNGDTLIMKLLYCTPTVVVVDLVKKLHELNYTVTVNKMGRTAIDIINSSKEQMEYIESLMKGKGSNVRINGIATGGTDTNALYSSLLNLLL